MPSKNIGRAGEPSSPLAAIRHRASKVANLWIFDSPKNGCRLTVTGDVPFMHLILLEGDCRVSSYQLVGDPFKVLARASNAALPGYVRVKHVVGPDTWLRIKRARAGDSKSHTEAGECELLRTGAAQAGAEYAEYSEVELRGRELEFENWLILCACLNRAKGHADYAELTAFVHLLQSNSSVSVRTLLGAAGVETAVMLAVIASSLQQGTAETELQRRPFGLDSVIKRRPG